MLEKIQLKLARRRYREDSADRKYTRDHNLASGMAMIGRLTKTVQTPGELILQNKYPRL